MLALEHNHEWKEEKWKITEPKYSHRRLFEVPEEGSSLFSDNHTHVGAREKGTHSKKVFLRR